ncbi:phosphatidylinositol N-acetylglucosaminyltransferase subunit Q isoform X2 [Hyalella azteca]|nr:phosphatidylinositol N-acetylglucosaminyltransferase subunit Q isoform X2 [Hyalella azteca]
MKVLLFFPQCCIKIQSFFQRIFDFQSATLTQLHVRVTQLNEMQRINEQMSSKIGQFFPSCLCQCTPKHSLKRNNQARCDKKGYQSHSTSLNKNAPSCDSAQDSHRYLKEPFSCKACPVYGCSNSIDWSCMPATATSDSLVLLRLFFVVLVDAALGISLLLWIQNVGSADIIYDWFLSMAQGVSSAVLQLLTWLKGAPAGLKLNQPLSVALATFFSYHVGLWMLYLEVAGGAVRALCWALVWSGPLGATVQLALLSDLLQLAALHLHCFYVYAARLHMVQISLLGSQWRAFRGNKWNPLKLRVDSLHCQPSPIHQPSGAIRPPCGDTSRAPLSRVLSAIIFTLVLFLLPTTTVYYVVFLSVRVVLVVVREVLRGAAWLLHHNPVFAPCLRLLRPSALRGEVEFESLPGLGERGAPVSLRVGVRCVPLTHVVRHFAASPSLPTFSLPSLSTVASALVYARTLI